MKRPLFIKSIRRFVNSYGQPITKEKLRPPYEPTNLRSLNQIKRPKSQGELFMKNKEYLCHQQKIKLELTESDKREFGINPGELSISDLDFTVITKEDKEKVQEVYKFIKKYEWLSTINNYWNYIFALTYNEKLVTVIMVGTPCAFSTLLGKDTKYLEQQILRGASCSIAPHNSGSYLMSKGIEFMIKHTPYRVFYGYSTMHEAFEFGHLYRACNFMLINKNAGTKLEYLKPGTQNKWLSDRHLRKLSNYKKISKRLGIEWQKEWSSNWSIFWNKMPPHLVDLIKTEQKREARLLTFRKVPPKLKYAYIKGRSKKETKRLLNLFKQRNPDLVNDDGTLGYEYPSKEEACKKLAIYSKGIENDAHLQ